MEHLNGTGWTGTGELWLDQRGDEALRHPCTLAIEGNMLRYTWMFEGKPQEGRLVVNPDGSAHWTDTWHQPSEVHCRPEPDAMGLVGVRYAYPAPSGPDWGWRIGVCQRPTGQVVLQMTNVTGWGEEVRAVRMIFDRKG